MRSQNMLSRFAAVGPGHAQSNIDATDGNHFQRRALVLKESKCHLN